MAERIRSGRDLTGQITQRRHFGGTFPLAKAVRSKAQSIVKNEQDAEVEPWDDEVQWRDAIGKRGGGETVAGRMQQEQDELREVSGELRSLSIDHWSLDDVVTYEPMPGGPKPPSVPSSATTNPNHMMPQSPWASDALKRQNYERVWTRKKIAKMETAIAGFALRVCRLLHLSSQRPSNLIVLPEAIRPFARLSADEQHTLRGVIHRRMRMLSNKAGYVAPNEPLEVPQELEGLIPKYEHFDDGLHHELLRDLNASLVELFDGYKNKQLDFLALMVKICHNLLVSSAPPNVQTMNILLLGFYSTDKYLKLSSSQVRHLIIDWLIEICLIVKIRPNEVTCATILATYRRRGMHRAFIEFVTLMRGTAGYNALMFTKPLSLNTENAARLTPTKDNPEIFKQSIYPSPMIFAEVIKGIAKFYNLQDAVAVCKDFTAKEWGYDWSCLRYLLQSCIIQKDWESGLWVWSEIKAFRAAGHEEPGGILAAMLALCVQCQQQAMFAEVLKYATEQLKHLTQDDLLKMATAALNRAVDRMDEDELLAAQTETGVGAAGDRGVYESRGFEKRVYRRLTDDSAFRRAVLGLGAGVRARIYERKFFDHQSGDNGDNYDFRSIRLQSDQLDEVEKTYASATHEVRDGQGYNNNNSTVAQPDLLREAEGGYDVKETEAVPSRNRRRASHESSERFSDSTMDLEEIDGALRNEGISRA